MPWSWAALHVVAQDRGGCAGCLNRQTKMLFKVGPPLEANEELAKKVAKNRQPRFQKNMPINVKADFDVSLLNLERN